MKQEKGIKEALDILREAMEADEEYAWGWHCNIAMAARDEGVDHQVANRAAKRFMRLLFGINTKEPQ